tara:strand:- start:161 stop:328 length:168 start_codon:yes stop_codon:yes gene_type:complete
MVKETSWTERAEEFLLENFFLGLPASLRPVLGSADFQDSVGFLIQRPASLLFFLN